MSSDPTTSPRTASAIQARRNATDAMMDRIAQALQQMRRERAHITVAAVARRASVSRTFLYQNEVARTLLAKALGEGINNRARDESALTAQVEATWKERALNAESELKRLYAEIALQRNRIGELLGQLRDLESDLPEDGAQRLITENHTLKGQVRQLTREHRRLEDRLAGSRDNTRFLDKRIAALEAQLLECLGPPSTESGQ
jgi:chromosome segregation ATPase